MDTKKLLSAIVVLFGFSGVASAALIQSVPGPFIDTQALTDPVIVDTTSDTGDWITNFTGTTGDTTKLYIGFDFQITNNNDETGVGGFFAGLGIFSGVNERALFGNAWEQLTYTGTAIAGASLEDTSIPYTVGETVRVVLELTNFKSVATNEDQWKMWIDPVYDDFATPNASAASGYNFNDFTRFLWRAGNGTGSATGSNVVFAAEFSDIVPVPEPGSLAMLAFGMISLWMFRRKR